MSIIKRLNVLLSTAAITFFAGFSSPSHALLNIPSVPLFVGIDSVPNVFIEMDDSGSMDWEVLTGRHFISCSYAVNPNGQICPGFTASDRMRFPETIGNLLQNYSYYSNTNDQTLDQGCPDVNSDVNGIAASARNCLDAGYNPLPDEWRFFSSDLNLMFFNPAVEYKPWVGFSNANFTAARANPQPGTTGFSDTVDLGGFQFAIWIDDKGFNGNNPSPEAIDMNDTPNGIVDLWDSHIVVTMNPGFGITCTMGSYESDGGDPARPVRTESPISILACLDAISDTGANVLTLRQNIANWYQYARRRAFVAKSAVADVLDRISGLRYGLSVINNFGDLFVEMPADDITDFSTHNDALLEGLLDYVWTSRGTPLRQGLERTGEYFDTDSSGLDDDFDSPIVESCQKNFTVLFSDGFWNGDAPTSTSIGDSDGDGATEGDADVVTLADVANHYYETDLAPGLAPNVPVDAFDNNTDQHMVTYTIAFGLRGSLRDIDGDGFPDPELQEDSTEWWDETINGNLRRVDDLWHAAFNSRGQFISAERPENISDALVDAIGNIEARTGTAASGSSNGGSISTESRVYQAIFNSGDWHGDFLAFDINNDGSLNTDPTWNAGELLNLQPNSYFAGTRKVFTYNPDEFNGTTFLWGNLTTAQQTQLGTDPNDDTVVDLLLGEARAQHIRGVEPEDINVTGLVGTPLFRERDNKLGDLVNSDPQFVGAPRFFFPFQNYQSFFTANRNRTPTIYIGGNDGMLHAFNADTGAELFTYIPNAVMENLNELTDPGYNHQFYVDGPPIYGDVRFGGAWHSVLAGALRSGGQAVYALDITDPDTFNASDVLWEFTDADDSDLGLVYGTPQIARMNNGKWAVILGNGFNSTSADGNVSADGDAVLFILFIEDGLDGFSAGDFVKIETSSGTLTEPNGMGPPGLADIDGDGSVDYIYTGDIKGNLWKFDVTSSDNTSWDVAFGGQPLFTATNTEGLPQPIIAAPNAIPHPLGNSQGALVVAGTGKYIEAQDADPTIGGTQSLYAVWDRSASLSISDAEGGNGFSRSQFAQIQIGTSGSFRVVNEGASDVPDWLNDDGNPADRGWFVDLPAAGERVIREVLVRNGVIFFVTLIPSEAPCVPGGTGFLMALDANTGGIPNPSQEDNPVPFDVNGDGEFDENDYIGSDQVVIGLTQSGIPNLPAVIFDPRPLCERNPEACEVDEDGDGVPDPITAVPSFPPPLNGARGCGSDGQRIYLYTTTSDGVISEATANLDNINCGRQAWRQLR